MQHAELSARFQLWPATAANVNDEKTDDAVLLINANGDELEIVVGIAGESEVFSKFATDNDPEFIDRLIEALMVAKSIARKADQQ